MMVAGGPDGGAGHADAPEPREHEREGTTPEGQLEVAAGARCGLSGRFEELEECRKRGFVTEEEYARKRAELMKCF